MYNASKGGATPESLYNPTTHQLTNYLNVFLRPSHPLGPKGRVLEYPNPLVITHEGTSQYNHRSVGASSSCGLCASNFIRLAFTKYLSKLPDRNLFQDLLTRGSFTESTSIAAHYQRNKFLEVQKIVGSSSSHPYLKTPPITGLPYFTWVFSTRELQPIINLPRSQHSFNSIMQDLDKIASPIAGAIITGPPVIVAVLKLPLASAPMGKVFIVFDSHTNHDLHPDGAGAIICCRHGDAAAFLTRRFPKLEFDTQPRLLDAGTLIDASFVVPRDTPPPIERDSLLLEASMRILHLEHDLTEFELRDKKAKAVPHAPTHQQYQSSKMEPGLEVFQASVDSAMSQLRFENTMLQTQLLTMQEDNDLQVKERQDLEQQYQRQLHELKRKQEELQQQQQHDRGGETSRSTRRGAEDARLAFERARRAIEAERQAMDSERQAMEAERQAMEAERQAMEKERQAMEKERRATGGERRATERERRTTERERRETEQAHQAFTRAPDAANKVREDFTKGVHNDRTTRTATAAAAQETSTAKRASRKPAPVPVQTNTRNDGRGPPLAPPFPLADVRNDGHRAAPQYVSDVRTDGRGAAPATPRPVYNTKGREAVPAPPRTSNDARNEARRGDSRDQRRGPTTRRP